MDSQSYDQNRSSEEDRPQQARRSRTGNGRVRSERGERTRRSRSSSTRPAHARAAGESRGSRSQDSASRTRSGSQARSRSEGQQSRSGEGQRTRNGQRRATTAAAGQQQARRSARHQADKVAREQATSQASRARREQSRSSKARGQAPAQRSITSLLPFVAGALLVVVLAGVGIARCTSGAASSQASGNGSSAASASASGQDATQASGKASGSKDSSSKSDDDDKTSSKSSSSSKSSKESSVDDEDLDIQVPDPEWKDLAQVGSKTEEGTDPTYEAAKLQAEREAKNRKNGYEGVESPWTKSGLFTTGDEELDEMVKKFCDSHTTQGKSAHDNAYNTFCNITWSDYDEWEGNQYPHSYDWAVGYAKDFFERGGNCFSMAAAIQWCMRYFGYSDAHAEVTYQERGSGGWLDHGLTWLTDVDTGEIKMIDSEMAANGFLMGPHSYNVEWLDPTSDWEPRCTKFSMDELIY